MKWTHTQGWDRRWWWNPGNMFLFIPFPELRVRPGALWVIKWTDCFRDLSQRSYLMSVMFGVCVESVLTCLRTRTSAWKARHLITSLTHSYTHFWKPPERSSILKRNRRPMCCAQADCLCLYNLWIYRVHTTHCSYRRRFGDLYDRVWALTPTLWISNRCLIHTLLLIRICLKLWDNKLTRIDPQTGGENHLS